MFTTICILLVTEYIYGIDHDLQARARSAIEAERFAYRS